MKVIKTVSLLMLGLTGLVGFIFAINDFSSGTGIGGSIALLSATLAFAAVAFFS